MLKILVASSKGGCGKSTVATNLAAHFAQSGKNTALLDADRQGSSYHWCERRPDTVPGVLGMANIKKGWATKLPPDTARVIIDSAAGIRASEVADYLDDIDVVLMPVLPSAFDLEASTAFAAEIAELPRIKRGKVPVGIIANRLKPWTTASQDGLQKMKSLPFPVVAELRDSTGYVMLVGLGKSIFDYGSEHVKSHQNDWAPLFKWLKKIG